MEPVEKVFIVLPSGIYLVNKEDSENLEKLKDTIYQHDITFAVMESMTNFLFLQQTMEVDLVLSDGTEVTLSLKDKKGE